MVSLCLRQGEIIVFLFLFSIPLHPVLAKQFLIDRYFGCCQYYILQIMLSSISNESKHIGHLLLHVSDTKCIVESASFNPYKASRGLYIIVSTLKRD